MKRRFVPHGVSCNIGKIHIPSEGFETDNEEIIGFLTSSPQFGAWFFEVQTKEALDNAIIANAKRLAAEKNEVFEEPVPVAPVEIPNIEKEEKALEAEEQARADDIALDKSIKEARRQANIEYEAKHVGKKRGRKPKAETANK